VAHTLPFMYAPHGHGQHLCYRVLSVACSGFLTVADIKCDVGATRDYATVASPFFSTSDSSLSEAPEGRFSPRSHLLTKLLVTFR